MNNITPHTLINTLKNKGYAVFEQGDYNLNIIGIRSTNSKSDKFDDFICVLYKIYGVWRLKVYNATTDPGKHWLLNPSNPNGTIIMVPGQYRGAFEIGLHGISGSYPYEALRQCKPIAYVRDNDKNLSLNFGLYKNRSNIFFELAFTNIHRTSAWKRILNIGRYSAGCQVIQDPNDFDEFMGLCHMQVKKSHGKTFTYTLIEEKDLL